MGSIKPATKTLERVMGTKPQERVLGTKPLERVMGDDQRTNESRIHFTYI
jgi:hypothetical protein